MKQQIITIIEKKGFIKNMNKSGISVTWNFLDTKEKFIFHIKYKEEEVITECSGNFVAEFQDLFNNSNRLMIMSDSDIENFKNNLITLINNYFK